MPFNVVHSLHPTAQDLRQTSQALERFWLDPIPNATNIGVTYHTMQNGSTNYFDAIPNAN